uniref:Cyanidin 3-O-glucoside 5-O-glucosyltransferase (acyl-glucose) n=2 Tax=Dianthus caryophyllus TaxID=3570 RepID=AA5GT_DIACA|nr:RecName: Full=Cyanidin 3-O-glucoside 5-O-glucosyltransferase (acyl-glucose); Short=AA5GT; Short=Dc AA5GT; AltName: Full=Acyl-glucose-dependent anthocyanin 5-O-glucosytransferase; AltName: Full=Beta-glucosidase like protein; Short=DcBGLUL; Flags: Precursor [Dianthus caryophyllus]BAJ33501.1 beta-glucosidase like protein [Dianthus caryophyllus]BAL45928.1 acyl-glucose-dependent anthocyanin 5-O-glucosytransferase [Dianthus caryophyllus]BBD75328.1 acacyl-glucose-dependent anthocyanin 5-O-glucosyltr
MNMSCKFEIVLLVSWWLLLVLVFGVESSMFSEFDRLDFPKHFIFGASSCAYQVEGAAFEDGRTLSTFDIAAHSGHLPGNGDITSDEYHKYKEDVELMVETGLDAYRFSISWSRLIPNGRGPVNPKGLEYYNNLVNALLTKGTQPHVTLLHSDLPQALRDEYGGLFISPKFIDDFVAYADVCFREFGDRVLHWTTFNEANFLAFGDENTPASALYLSAHHLLLAHASATRLYRENYQASQRGFIGINVYAYDFIPETNTEVDVIAAKRARDFFIGWFVQPLMNGEYPLTMRKNGGPRLPKFTPNETELLTGSYDFIGLNYYTAKTVKDDPVMLTVEPRNYYTDQGLISSYLGNIDPYQGHPFFNTPWGLHDVLQQFKQVYGNPPVYIHENGEVGDHDADYDKLINDIPRVEYLQGHIRAVLDAVRNGSNVKGYFVWSFLDMYELMYGTKFTFGLYYIDFNDPKLTRHPKLSQKWYSRFLKGEKASTKASIHTPNEAETHTYFY